MHNYRLALVSASLVLLSSGATGLHLPTQNDAGSGMDAPDFQLPEVAGTTAHGLPIGAGTWHGNFTHSVAGIGADIIDQYRLDPPPKTVVRVRIAGDIDAARIWGPAGRDDATLLFGPGEVEVSAAAPAGEPYTLQVHGPGTPGPAGSPAPYQMEVRFEPHDHFRPLQANGTVEGWEVALSEGGYARIEVTGARGGSGATGSRFVQELTSPGEVEDRDDWKALGCGTGLHTGWSAGPAGARNVWLQGPADIEDPVPGSPVENAVDTAKHGAWDRWKLWEVWPSWICESGRGNFTAYVGLVDTDGLDRRGWVVWDDPVDVTIRNVSARARILSLADLRGEGPAVQVGPTAYAENVSASLEVPDNRTWSSVFTLDPAVREAITNRPNHWHVEMPDRPREHVVVGEEMGIHRRAQCQFATMRPDHVDVPTGTWRVHAQHAEGLTEYNGTRVALASFAFPPDAWC